ncbi:MAG: hypothetical protein J6L71_02665 [Clostridia bacterium]|nr:hypothetical protein [Clostridia bacterium]
MNSISENGSSSARIISCVISSFSRRAATAPSSCFAERKKSVPNVAADSPSRMTPRWTRL